MNRKIARRVTALAMAAITLVLSHPVFADSTSSVAGVSNVQSFITSLTKVVVIITGSVTILMFAIGGLQYGTSSGNPEHLQRAKHTLLYAGIGLAIAAGSAILGGIVAALASSAFGS